VVYSVLCCDVSKSDFGVHSMRLNVGNVSENNQVMETIFLF